MAVLLAEGMSVREIAAATGRKESTMIRSHVKRMFAKHGLTRQAELVRRRAVARARGGLPARPMAAYEIVSEIAEQGGRSCLRPRPPRSRPPPSRAPRRRSVSPSCRGAGCRRSACASRGRRRSGCPERTRCGTARQPARVTGTAPRGAARKPAGRRGFTVPTVAAQGSGGY